jgi:MoaA/NifB/PqqE/SkfB family radical SAM enzyme
MKTLLDIRKIPNSYWWDAQGKFDALVSNENKLKEITIQVTDKCNMNCTKCNKKNFTFQDMETETVLRIIDEACELGLKHVHFTGGEPTLHPDFVKIIAHCKDKNLRIDMSSNGTFSKELFLQLVDAGINSINISWDFILKRPKCISFIRDLKIQNVDIFLNHMVMPENYIELPTFLLLMTNYSFIKDIQLMPPRGSAQKFSKEQIKEYNKLIRHNVFMNNRFPMVKAKVFNILADKRADEGIYHDEITWPCHRSKSELRVGTKGFVTCTYLYRDGHVTCRLDKSVKEAWEICKQECKGNPPIKDMCDYSCSPEVCYFNKNVELALSKKRDDILDYVISELPATLKG